MKRKKLIVLCAILIIAVLVLGLTACNNENKGGGGNENGGDNNTPPVIITPDTPLSDVTAGLKKATNYTVAMSYLADGLRQNLSISVTEDKIIDTLSYVKGGKQIVEVTACAKESGKYYEYINRTVTDAPVAALANAGQSNSELVYIPSPLNTKREVSKVYFDKKYGEVVEVYIPLMDPINYEKGADNKYKLKEEKVAEFAGKMSASVADVKKITIEVKDGQVALNAPGVTIAGKENISVEIKDVGETVAELIPEMTTAQTEGLNINNAYARFNAGGMEMINQHFTNGIMDANGKGYYWIKGGNFECYGYSEVSYNKMKGKAHYALYTDNGNYVELINRINDDGITHTKRFLSYNDYNMYMNSQLSIIKLMLSSDFWIQTADGYEHLLTPEAKQKCMALYIDVMTDMNMGNGYVPDTEEAEAFYNQFVAGSTLEITGETATFMVWSDSERTEGFKYIMSNFGNCEQNLPDIVKNAPFESTEKPEPLPDEPDEPEPKPDGEIYNFDSIAGAFDNGLYLSCEAKDVTQTYTVNGDKLVTTITEKGCAPYSEYYFIKEGKYYMGEERETTLLRPMSKTDYDWTFQLCRTIFEECVGKKEYWDFISNGRYQLRQKYLNMFLSSIFDPSPDAKAELQFTSEGFEVLLTGSYDGSYDVRIVVSNIGSTVEIPEDIYNAPKAIYVYTDNSSSIKSYTNLIYLEENEIRSNLESLIADAGYDINDTEITTGDGKPYNYRETTMPIEARLKSSARYKYSRVQISLPKEFEWLELNFKKGGVMTEAFLRNYFDKFLNGAQLGRVYTDFGMTSPYRYGKITGDTEIFAEALLNTVRINIYDTNGDMITSKQIKRGETITYAEIIELLSHHYNVFGIYSNEAQTVPFTEVTPDHGLNIYFDGESKYIYVSIETRGRTMSIEIDKGTELTYELVSRMIYQRYEFTIGRLYIDEDKTIEVNFNNLIGERIQLYDESYLSMSESIVIIVNTSQGWLDAIFANTDTITYELLKNEIEKHYGFTIGKLYTDESKTTEFDFSMLNGEKIQIYDESYMSMSECIVINVNTNQGGIDVNFAKTETITYELLKNEIEKRYGFTVGKLYIDESKTTEFDFSNLTDDYIQIYDESFLSIEERVYIQVITNQGSYDVVFAKTDTITYELLKNEIEKHYGFTIGKLYIDENKTTEVDFSMHIGEKLQIYDDSYMSMSESIIIFINTNQGGMDVNFSKTDTITYELLKNEIEKRYGFTIGKLYIDKSKTTEFDFSNLTDDYIQLYDESFMVESQNIIIQVIINNGALSITFDNKDTITYEAVKNEIELQHGYIIGRLFIDETKTKEFDFSTFLGEYVQIYDESYLPIAERKVFQIVSNQGTLEVFFAKTDTITYEILQNKIKLQYGFTIGKLYLDESKTEEVDFLSLIDEKILIYDESYLSMSERIVFQVITNQGTLEVFFSKTEMITYELLRNEIEKKCRYTIGKLYTDESKTTEFDFSEISNEGGVYITIFDESSVK